MILKEKMLLVASAFVKAHTLNPKDLFQAQRADLTLVSWRHFVNLV